MLTTSWAHSYPQQYYPHQHSPVSSRGWSPSALDEQVLLRAQNKPSLARYDGGASIAAAAGPIGNRRTASSVSMEEESTRLLDEVFHPPQQYFDEISNLLASSHLTGSYSDSFKADVISNNNKPGLNMHAVNLNNNYAPYVVREAKLTLVASEAKMLKSSNRTFDMIKRDLAMRMGDVSLVFDPPTATDLTIVFTASSSVDETAVKAAVAGVLRQYIFTKTVPLQHQSDKLSPESVRGLFYSLVNKVQQFANQQVDRIIVTSASIDDHVNGPSTAWSCLNQVALDRIVAYINNRLTRFQYSYHLGKPLPPWFQGKVFIGAAVTKTTSPLSSTSPTLGDHGGAHQQQHAEIVKIFDRIAKSNAITINCVDLFTIVIDGWTDSDIGAAVETLHSVFPESHMPMRQFQFAIKGGRCLPRGELTKRFKETLTDAIFHFDVTGEDLMCVATVKQSPAIESAVKRIASEITVENVPCTEKIPMDILSKCRRETGALITWQVMDENMLSIAAYSPETVAKAVAFLNRANYLHY